MVYEADTQVLDLGHHRGTVAELLEIDAREPFLPDPVREDFTTEVLRTGVIRAGRG